MFLPEQGRGRRPPFLHAAHLSVSPLPSHRARHPNPSPRRRPLPPPGHRRPPRAPGAGPQGPGSVARRDAGEEDPGRRPRGRLEALGGARGARRSRGRAREGAVGRRPVGAAARAARAPLFPPLCFRVRDRPGLGREGPRGSRPAAASPLLRPRGCRPLRRRAAAGRRRRRGRGPRCRPRAPGLLPRRALSLGDREARVLDGDGGEGAEAGTGDGEDDRGGEKGGERRGWFGGGGGAPSSSFSSSSALHCCCCFFLPPVGPSASSAPLGALGEKSSLPDSLLDRRRRDAPPALLPSGEGARCWERGSRRRLLRHRGRARLPLKPLGLYQSRGSRRVSGDGRKPFAFFVGSSASAADRSAARRV